MQYVRDVLKRWFVRRVKEDKESKLPLGRIEDVDGAAVVHWKGKRWAFRGYSAAANWLMRLECGGGGMMGWRPTSYCKVCGEPFDVFTDDPVCGACKEEMDIGELPDLPRQRPRRMMARGMSREMAEDIVDKVDHEWQMGRLEG